MEKCRERRIFLELEAAALNETGMKDEADEMLLNAKSLMDVEMVLTGHNTAIRLWPKHKYPDLPNQLLLDFSQVA